MDFDNFVKVLCVSSESTVKGLQQVFDRNLATASRRFQLFIGKLAELEQIPATHYDLIILTLDLGQPVPLEHLKKIPEKMGLATVIQPTPQQLLALGSLAHWHPVLWDGINYELLANALNTWVERFEKQLLTQNFMHACKAWWQHNSLLPASLELMNAPESWAGRRVFKMDPNLSVLSLGAAQSKADVVLPPAGAQELGEFRFQQGKWLYRSKNKARSSQNEYLKVGDQVEESGFLLQVKSDPKVEEFTRVARRYRLVNDDIKNLLAHEKEKTVYGICKDLLLAGVTGELRLKSELKQASVFFTDGVVGDVVAGAVGGVKALLRVFTWPQPTWDFFPDRRTVRMHSNLGVNASDLYILYQRWNEQWQKMHSLIPPLHLRIRAIPKAFKERVQWTERETQVLACICEHGMVRDVLNFCNLHDLEVVETLVHLRKQGLIEPAAQGK